MLYVCSLLQKSIVIMALAHISRHHHHHYHLLWVYHLCLYYLSERDILSNFLYSSLSIVDNGSTIRAFPFFVSYDSLVAKVFLLNPWLNCGDHYEPCGWLWRLMLWLDLTKLKHLSPLSIYHMCYPPFLNELLGLFYYQSSFQLV